MSEKKWKSEIWQGTCEIQKKWGWEMLKEINIQMFSISLLSDIYVLPKPVLNYVVLKYLKRRKFQGCFQMGKHFKRKNLDVSSQFLRQIQSKQSSSG